VPVVREGWPRGYVVSEVREMWERAGLLFLQAAGKDASPLRLVGSKL